MVSLALRRATSWSCKEPFFVLLTIVVLSEGLFGRARADFNCPFSTAYIRAYPDPVTFDIEYTFDPTVRNVTYTRYGRGDGPRWRVNGLTTGASRVQCDWTVEAGDSDHTVSVTVVLTAWLTSDQSSGDCWTVYDGDVSYGRELGEVCEGQGATEKTFRGTDHSLFVVFNQGARTGLRSLRFRYRSEPTEEPKKTNVAQLAAVSSVVIAALGIGFLVLRFTHCCRPCRKRWCPQCTTQMNKDEDEEEMGGNPSGQRELTHLTPTAPSAQGDTGLNSRLALPQHGTRTPSAPTDLGPDEYEHFTARALMDEGEEGYHDSSVLEGATEGRFLGWHESEVGGGGGGGGGGGSRRGSHRSSSADVQASFPESARGSGGGGGEEEEEGERVPRPSGLARPPPAYEALFGTEGETKI